MLIILVACILGLFSNLNVASSEITYTCDFARDTCGFTNEEGHNINWERMEMEIGARKPFVMAVETNGTDTQLTRMSTPYFNSHKEQPGCLSFTFYTSGKGVRRLSVEQEHDYGITSIFVNSYTSYSGAGWHKPQMEVDIDASTRFFFTATLTPSLGESFAAVSRTRLRLSKC